jgi:MFS family permease
MPMLLGRYSCAGYLHWSEAFLIIHSVLQEYYQAHQLSAESTSAISWIGSLQVFFLLAGGLVGGPLFDRYGSKVCHQSRRGKIGIDRGIHQVIWPAAVVFIFAVMMTSICKTYYQFLLAQGVLGGLSMG